jgi:hypothetical protein
MSVYGFYGESHGKGTVGLNIMVPTNDGHVRDYFTGADGMDTPQKLPPPPYSVV